MPSVLSLQHRIKEPSIPTKASPPLLLLLHGLGGDEGSLFFLASKLDPRFFFASVRAPYELGESSYAWFHVEFAPTGAAIRSDEAESSRVLLLGFIDELAQAYGTDPRRVYLLGFSQGAMVSLCAALSCPEKVAGLVAASGRILPELLPGIASPDRLEGLPIFVSHGIRDEVVPIHHGRAIRDRLARSPVDLSYREYDMKHEIRQECIADMSAWLSSRLGKDEANE
jgi:phospholipase/carboxylesterase